MKSILANWKTTAAGVAAILAALADMLGAVAHGTPPNLSADILAIMAGVGLIVAHDGMPAKS
jgi:hypothetical protein